jgi:D-xylulose kinase
MVSNKSALFASIDIGTTGGRTIVFDAKGKLISQAYSEYGCIYPTPVCVEQKASDWWETTKKTVKEVLKNSNVTPSQIVGLSVTNQRETIVPVSEDGEALSNAIVWQDRRTTEECNEIEKTLGEETIYQITGLTIDPYFSGPKILWLKKHSPEIFEKTFKFVLVHDYILFKLTGIFATDYSNASRTMLFDIDKHSWSDKILNTLELPKEKLVTPYPSGKEIGTLTKKAAQATGLPEGLSIITGGGDQQCAALGVGVTEPGRVKATTGTGTFLLAFLKDSLRDSKRRVLCSCHAIPDAYVLEASIFTTGAVLRWFRDNFSFAEKSVASCTDIDSYDLLGMQANDIPAGSEGVMVIPHFTGAGAPYWNPHAKGQIFGLSIGHTRSHIIRAIMEATGYEIRTNLEVFQDLGVNTKELRITGGAARNKTWNQIQADITHLPVIRGKVEEATALGAAILASIGTNYYPDISTAAKEMITITEKHPVDEDHMKKYNNYYDIYQQLYPILNNHKLYDSLAKINSLRK